MNQLSVQELVERNGLIQIDDQPTRGSNKLDRIYVCDEQFRKVRVVTSAVRSDHKAVFAHLDKDHHIRKIITKKVQT
jgi:endonuclease/exonuclease/phosphatase family metal-dependent hydrolase